MLPPSLFSSYHEYKQDTNSVAAWLASTAKAHGYTADISRPEASKSAGRLKGKARTQAKKVSQSLIPKHIIRVKDFVPLAEFIACKPDLSVPTSFVATLDRVIKKRNGVSSKLAQNEKTSDTTSDKSHEHFVGILEKVQDILKPRVARISMGTEARNEDVLNKFAALELQEPSEEFLDSPDICRPSNAEGDKEIYEVEPQTSLQDYMLALTMVVNDLNRIRAYVKCIWSKYENDTLDLTAAAISTNTAIDLGRKLTEDIAPQFELHGGMWKVLHQLYQSAALSRGYNTGELFTEGQDNIYGIYDVAEQTYVLTLRIISSIQDTLEPGQIPVCEKGNFSYDDARSDRKSKSANEKLLEDGSLLVPFLIELVTVVRAVPNYPVEDEFLRGIREMVNTKEVPFYLLFAAQIFLDIHHTIRGHAKEGFTTLVEQLKFMDGELDKHFEFHQDLKNDNWPASQDHVLRQFQAQIKDILADPVYNMRLKMYSKMGIQIPSSMKPNRMLAMSPVLSGLMLYHFRAEIYNVGIELANAWGSITCAAHLYHAVRQEEAMKVSWLDMHVVRSLLGISNFFVGGPPQNPEEYLRRFMLQIGISAAAVTNNRRRRAPLASKSGSRMINKGALVSCMFMDRYLYNTGQVEWTPEHVDKVVDLSTWKAEGGRSFVSGQTNNPGNSKAKDSKGKEKSRGKATESGLLPPGELVWALARTLHMESLEFTLPYITMHRQCLRALHAVKLRCDPLLSDYAKRENRLVLIVGDIFSSAANDRDDRLLLQASTALEGFVRAEGQGVLRASSALGFSGQFATQGALPGSWMAENGYQIRQCRRR